MKKILIIGSYPTLDNIKDGMIQRISAIDAELSSYHRTYICFGHSKYEIQHINSTLCIINCNKYKHYHKIKKIIKEKYDGIYTHSIYNARDLLFYNLRHIPTRILDFHGAIPEEIQFFGGNRIVVKIWNIIERLAIHQNNKFVAVSQNMINYYEKKYKLPESCFYLKPIMARNNYVDITKLPYNIELLKNKINGRPTIIYSGNFQKWQNLDMMLEFVKKTIGKYFFIFLSGQPDILIQRIKDINSATENNIFINSVKPDELGYYYKLAHYGFLLRDDDPLNFVAFPTKLTEYLEYGITPILKYTEVGDQNFLKYKYITYEEAQAKDLLAQKSSHNINVFNQIKSLTLKTSVNTLI